jgi:hypothetical protein
MAIETRYFSKEFEDYVLNKQAYETLSEENKLLANLMLAQLNTTVKDVEDKKKLISMFLWRQPSFYPALFKKQLDTEVWNKYLEVNRLNSTLGLSVLKDTIASVYVENPNLKQLYTHLKSNNLLKSEAAPLPNV